MRVALVLCCVMAFASLAESQQRRRTPARPAAKPKAAAPVAPTVADAVVKCPEQLGTGVRTKANFCFVLAGRDPAEGVLVSIPAHTGTATLTFNLHNRHTYSEEQMRAGQGYASYTAVVAVLQMDGTLLGRGAVQTEFRKASDLYDRVSGGAGPGGVKAVAPIGSEAISVTIPATVTQVSLLGEVLEATTAAGRETAAPGRPVAIVSNVRIEYKPAAAKR